MKKKHQIKTIDDIKYCEEHCLTIYSAVDGHYYEFNDGQWNEYDDDVGNLRAYNACLPLDFDLYYYEEEQEQQEATAEDVGKLCWFWDRGEDDKQVSVLNEIKIGSLSYYSKNLGIYFHCRPLTKAEIQEFMEKAE